MTFEYNRLFSISNSLSVRFSDLVAVFLDVVVVVATALFRHAFRYESAALLDILRLYSLAIHIFVQITWKDEHKFQGLERSCGKRKIGINYTKDV